MFIAGNMPMVSEITPLIIITKLEQYDYTGATAVAVVMLLVSFTLLLVINAAAMLEPHPLYLTGVTAEAVLAELERPHPRGSSKTAASRDGRVAMDLPRR